MVYRESATVNRAKQCCFLLHFDTYRFNMTKLVAEHFLHAPCRIGIAESLAGDSDDANTAQRRATGVPPAME